MYRINLYPEFALKRRGAKQRRVQFLAVATLLAVAAIISCTTIISALVLGEQARSRAASIPRLSELAQTRSIPRPEVALARELITVRRNRIDWSPKLAALSERIPNSLILDRIAGRVTVKGQPAQLIVEGTVRSGRAPLDEVSGFLDSLRTDTRIVRDFPAVKLGSIKERDSGQFEVICEPAGSGS